MPARFHIFICLMALFVPVNAVFSQSIDFNRILSFAVPEISTISEFCFDDIDYDGTPEILALCHDTLVLYSSTLDSVLFTTLLDSAYYHKIALGDINRDSIVDIAVAYVYPISGWAWNGVIDSAYAIEIFDGASGYTPTARVYYPNFPGSDFQQYQLGAGMVTFAAMDVNSDGYDNLLLSYGNDLIDKNPTPHYWSSGYPGRFDIFHSFPDSLLHHSSLLFFNPRMAPFSSASFLVGSHRYKYAGGTPSGDTYLTHYSFILFNPAADDYYNLFADTNLECTDQHEIERVTRILSPVCIGDIDPSIDGLEVAAIFGFSQSCEYPAYSYTSGSVMRMYHRDSELSVSLLWQRDPVHSYTTFLYHPYFPGAFLGYYYSGMGLLYVLDGRTGDEIGVSNPVPSGKLSWCYPFNPSIPYMVITNNAHVDIYDIVNPTDADDDAPLPLPTTLSLGIPYPNPFNAAQTIPVTVKAGGSLTVDVYDILGRKVERLYDGKAEKGKFGLIWNAGAHASGVYFVRATSDGNSAVVRSILIK